MIQVCIKPMPYPLNNNVSTLIRIHRDLGEIFAQRNSIDKHALSNPKSSFEGKIIKGKDDERGIEGQVFKNYLSYTINRRRSWLVTTKQLMLLEWSC